MPAFAQPIFRFLRKRRFLAIWFCGALAVAATIVLAFSPLSPLDRLNALVFDAYQNLQPRPAAESPVVVVDIDDDSIRKFGQWPWPRTLSRRHDRPPGRRWARRRSASTSCSRSRIARRRPWRWHSCATRVSRSSRRQRTPRWTMTRCLPKVSRARLSSAAWRSPIRFARHRRTPRPDFHTAAPIRWNIWAPTRAASAISRRSTRPLPASASSASRLAATASSAKSR